MEIVSIRSMLYFDNSYIFRLFKNVTDSNSPFIKTSDKSYSEKMSGF